jgi:acylphosphatase
LVASRRAVQVRITGQVQGVGYRVWALGAARDLGLAGWVRNRADGSVEARVEGAAEDVAAFIERARRGPRAARVSDIALSEEPLTGDTGFGILPTA